jgi:type VI secretion system secreted protein VgrG
VKHDDEDKPTSGPPPEASVPPEPTRAATNTPYVPPTEAPEPTAEPPTEAPPQPTEAPPEPTDEPPQPTAEP